MLNTKNKPSTHPENCLLCNGAEIDFAGFTQMYRQQGGGSVPVTWWQCGVCGGWFASPHPTIKQVNLNWEMVDYQQESKHETVAESKGNIHQKILAGIDSRIGSKKDCLLDVGCNYGDFLGLAKESGWTPYGFDASESAVAISTGKGFDVRMAWNAKDAGFEPNQFSAVVVNDVFCYARHPYDELKQYALLLKPGGVLAMRITNKHLALKFARAIVGAEEKKNKILSGILLDQFHSISINALMSVLVGIGFTDMSVVTNAYTTPLRYSSWKTRISYVASHFFYYLSLGRMNLYPGVILFAKKT